MTELISTLVQTLDPIQRLVLTGKSQGISDGDLAGRINRSRPWLADRKAEILDLIQRELMAQLPDELHSEAAGALLDGLADVEEAQE
jgi:hypothetical protein